MHRIADFDLQYTLVASLIPPKHDSFHYTCYYDNRTLFISRELFHFSFKFCKEKCLFSLKM